MSIARTQAELTFLQESRKKDAKYRARELDKQRQLKRQLLQEKEQRIEKYQSLAQNIAARRQELDGAALLASAAVLAISAVKAGVIIARSRQEGLLSPGEMDSLLDRKATLLVEGEVNAGRQMAQEIERDPDSWQSIVDGAISALEEAGIPELEKLLSKLDAVIEVQNNDELSEQLALDACELAARDSLKSGSVTEKKDENGRSYREVSLNNGFVAEVNDRGKVSVINSIQAGELEAAINEISLQKVRRSELELIFAKSLAVYCSRDGINKDKSLTRSGMLITIDETQQGDRAMETVTLTDTQSGRSYRGTFSFQVDGDNIKILEDSLSDSFLAEEAKRLANVLSLNRDRPQAVVG